MRGLFPKQAKPLHPGLSDAKESLETVAECAACTVDGRAKEEASHRGPNDSKRPPRQHLPPAGAFPQGLHGLIR